MIEVQALGGLRVVVDGAELHSLPTRPRRAALLAYLAVTGSESREKLCFLFWPDHGPDRARHNLRQTLYELRRDLGADALKSPVGQVRVSERVRVDVNAIDALLKAEHYRDAIDRYGGPFLDGAELAASPDFERWVEATRRRLHRRLGAAFRVLYEGTADAAERVAIARRWVVHDPLDDEAQHGLIASLGALGRRREALQQYDRYVALIRDELDIEPLERTVELAKAIRSADGIPLEGTRSNGAQAIESLDPVAPDSPRNRTEEVVGGPAARRSIQASPSSANPLRPRWNWWAAALAVIVLVGAILVRSNGPSVDSLPEGTDLAGSRDRVVVLPFDNLTGDTAVRLIGDMVAAVTATRLVDERIGTAYLYSDLYGLGVFDPTDSLTLPSTPRDRVVEVVGAGTVVSGRIVSVPAGPVVMANLFDLTSGVPQLIQNIQPVPIDVGAPGPAVAQTADRILALAAAYIVDPAISPDRAMPGNLTPPPNLEAFRAYQRGLALANESDWGGAAAAFLEAYAMDTTNVVYGIEAAGRVASAAQQRGYTTNGPEWNTADSLIRALEPRAHNLNPVAEANFRLVRAWVSPEVAWDDMWRAARRLPSLAPGTLEHYKGAFASAQAHRMAEAVQILEALDQDRGSLADWAPTSVWLYTAYWFLGDFDGAAAVAGEAAVRFSASIATARYFQALRAAALTRQGKDDEVLGVLDEVEHLDVRPCSRATAYVRVIRESIRMGRDLGSGAAGSAVDWFERGFKDHETCRNYGMALVHLEDWDRATRFWRGLDRKRLAEGVDPALDEYAYRAIALAGSGDPDGAGRELARLSQAAGADRRGEGRFLAATVLYQMGDTLGALDYVRDANRRGYARADIGMHPLALRLWEHPMFQEFMEPVG